MLHKLLIVESPAKAKTIEKYLGEGFVVSSSVGHIRDLPKSNKKAIDIEGGFIPTYEVSPGKQKIITELRKLAKTADDVYLATDPDREGEAIAWHLKEVLKLKNAKRVSFNEITKEVVQEAIKNPRKIDEDLRQAQEARRVLDRLVGYDLSGLIWKKVRYGLSAGRVQSPALRIIMERERQIRAFNPENFWVIRADVKAAKKEQIQITCVEEPRDEKEVKRIIEVGEKGIWKVANIKETKAKRTPKPPFTTSTLQQTASTRLGFSPSNTMRIAQRLYEAGLITYMRTDSTNLGANAMKQITSVISDEFGKELLETRVFKTKTKNAQEAHEAIRPSDVSLKIAGKEADQKKLYELIRNRTIASQMKDSEALRTKITVEINDGEIPNFTVNGQRVIFDGWLLADPAAKGEEVNLPEIAKDLPLKLKKIDSEAKQTQPPSRYTEAGLIKELEKRGIGRPSTFASTIKTLLTREYVTKEGRTLTPTDTGDVVSSFLEENFAKYISDDFTAEMETNLDSIANGEKKYVQVLSHFYKPFLKDVKSKEDIPKLTNLGSADEKYKCPKCGGDMVIKLGRGGKFISCAKFPDCDGALTIDGQEIKPDEPIGIHSETKEPIFVKIGRYGPYVQLGEGGKDEKGKKIKPRMASIPKDKNFEEVTVEDAEKYLSLPKILGKHPDSNKNVTASIGRFGPYIVHDGDFRSLKTDDVYTIEIERALEILREPKRSRGWNKKKK